MINYIWSFLILIGFLVGICNGKIVSMSDSILSSSSEAIELCILMAGVVGLWSGIMNVAVNLGLIHKLELLLSPFLHFLFPNLPKGPAKSYIATNFAANLLGLGWASTPSGLNAMKELQKMNPTKHIATNEMCSFIILNISSLQLIPINIIAYRSQYGSAHPTSILIPGFIATTISTAVAIIYIKWKDIHNS